MVSTVTPLEHFNRFCQKQQAEAQFCEDIRHVINGGGSLGGYGDDVGVAGRQRGMRARSPGLAAGAALALGCGAAPGGQVRLPHQEASDIARQLKERSRGSGCPFDDHSAFSRQGAASPWSSTVEEPSRLLQPSAPSQQREAFEASRSVGRRNRDAQTKIGSTAPWDAPETSIPMSSYTAAARGAFIEEAPAAPAGYSEARREAATNRSRMAGSDGIISGGYLQGDGRGAPVGRSTRPPPQPAGLLPQAMLKAQMDNLGPVSKDRAAYLNSKVMSEACRERNTSVRFQLG